MRPSRVWYLAYGSNINRNRFQLYLDGAASEPGARDATPPARHAFAEVPLRLEFARRSRRWNGGGVAFVTPGDGDRPATWVRGWDITAEQFEDVFAQENRQPVGRPLPWSTILAQTSTDVDGRWYQRILHLPVIELERLTPGQPCVTFTWAEPATANPPDAEYRATIATGLDDHPDLDRHEIDRYLDAATLGP